MSGLTAHSFRTFPQWAKRRSAMPLGGPFWKLIPSASPQAHLFLAWLREPRVIRSIPVTTRRCLFQATTFVLPPSLWTRLLRLWSLSRLITGWSGSSGIRSAHTSPMPCLARFSPPLSKRPENGDLVQFANRWRWRNEHRPLLRSKTEQYPGGVRPPNARFGDGVALRRLLRPVTAVE